MWRVIILVFCYHVMSQPVTDEPQTRHTRELIECCPCPGSSHGGQDMLSRSLGRSADDCPCRFRSADSEGASSLLFPTKTAGKPISSVPFMRSNDPNDMKNLLEPEVGLAKSMLQTLREATEEEYQDAVARDAARSSDAVPEESARNVVIIVKPRASADEDDFVSEASNVKEARCINPLGSPLGKMRTVSNPLRTLPDFLRLPKPKQPNFVPRNLWDMDSNLGASNIQEKELGTNGEAEDVKPQSQLFKFRTPLKENALVGNVLKTPSVFDKLEHTLKNRPNLFERFNLPSIPKMKVDSPLQKDIDANNDLKPALSNTQELIEKEDGKGPFSLNKRPLMLKNLLKLKDVELVPRTILRMPIFKSKLNSKDTLPSLSRDHDGDTNCRETNNDSVTNEKVILPKIILSKSDENFEAKSIPNEDSSLKNIASSIVEPEEEYQDAITSPSEIITKTLGNTQNTIELDKSDYDNLSLEEIIPTTTEGIPTVLEEDGSSVVLDPTAESEIHEITANEDDSNTSKSCEADEIVENGVEDAEPIVDNTNNIENVIPFTSQGSSILQPQILEHEQDTTTPINDVSESIISDQNIQDKTQSIEPKAEDTSKNITSKIKPMPPLSETWSTIKDNVRKSLENLKKKTTNENPTIPMKNSRSSQLKTGTPIQDLDQEPRNDRSVEELHESKDNEKLLKVTFNDLQKLSDDLLVLSSNKEQEIPLKESDSDEVNMLDFKPNEVKGKHDQTEPDSLTEPTTKNEFVAPREPNVEFTPKKTCRVDANINIANQKSAQESKRVFQNEDKKDMSVEASAPVARTLPALIDPLNPLNLNEQLGTSLLQLNPLDPLRLNDKLGSSLLPNLDPLNINEKLRSSVFPDVTPLSVNEQLPTSLLPSLDPLNLNEKLGSALDPLNLSEKIESILQPNLDPLNVRSSLQDIIVQPTIPDNPLKFLGKPVAEVLKLPTLEDLRERLSSFFDNNGRSAENNFSDEDGDCTNVAPVEMASAASTANLLKVPLRPLEDMNVDILQLNPLSKSDLFSSAPRLNLNNFRAKLPIPNNLDLKPVKLESRVANNKGNVFGAALSFGNDKATSRKPKPNYSNPLDRPIGTLPSLDELRSTLQSGTQNLLGTPPLQPNLDLFKDLRASGIPDLDEIRRNAEKTMKGLQQRMKSTFKSGNINPLSEKFAKPQDLLEDVNDKLKAIHYDLNDRLSSIHEDILDQSKLNHVSFPALPTFPINRNTNTNIMNNIRNRGKPARLQTSASKFSAREMNSLENTNDRTLLSSPPRTSPKRVQANYKTLLDAESAPVPTKVEFPKTAVSTPRKLTLSPLPHLPSLRQGSGNSFLQNIREKQLGLPRQPALVKDLNKPILRKPSPFKDKNGKVTITFATSTASPINQFRTTPSVKTSKPSLNIKSSMDSLKERLTQPTSKAFGDGRQSASELKSMRSKSNFKTAHSDKTSLPQLQNLDSIENIKPTLSTFKGTKDPQLRLNKNNAIKLDTAWDNNKPETKNVEVLEEANTKSLVWPKTGEDSFLAKVRHAMQARLNNFNPTKVTEKVAAAKVESSSTDMIRSASENNDVIVEEPLKENVSYKCKMVCTRE